MLSSSIYYQNVRGLNTKLNDFKDNCASSNFNIIALTETWLNDSVYNAEIIEVNNFTVFRSDRNFQETNSKKGGGVLLAFNNIYNVQLITSSSSSTFNPWIDFLFVKLTFNAHSFYILLLYIPPQCSTSDYAKFFDEITYLNHIFENNLLILGDFNIPEYLDNSSLRSMKSADLEKLVNLLNLQQYNCVPNHFNRYLDLVFATFPCKVERSHDLLTTEDHHHPPLIISLELLKNNKKHFISSNSQSSFWNFHKADLPKLYTLTSQVDWSFLINSGDVNKMCQSFYEKIYSLFELCVPKCKRIKSFHKYPKWFNNKIIMIIKKKFRFWRLYKLTGRVSFYNTFKSLRTSLKNEIKKSRAQYIENMESKINTEPKTFWTYINNKTSEKSIPKQMFIDNTTLQHPQDIADAFASFFESNFLLQTPTEEFKQNCPYNLQTLTINNFDLESVFACLKKLKPKKTTGPDGIPAFYIHDCAESLAYPFFLIANLSLNSSVFPSLFKMSSITPIFKKGDKRDVRNYRPISLICNFSKCLETLLHDVIGAHVRKYISPHQHGFISGRSTTTNLACFSQYVSETIDLGLQLDVFYADFSKAFDSVNFDILLHKLSCYGLSLPLIELLNSYLRERYQYVFLNGFKSHEILVTSGVPQGSILGPLLFLLFINDVTNVLEVPCLLYADDLKFFVRVSTVNDCALLQQSIDKLTTWSKKNYLQLNISKCFIAQFTNKSNKVQHNYHIDNSSLKNLDKFLDLGVMFDLKLSFVPHVEYIVAKSSRMLGFLIRNSRDFSKVEITKLLFYSFVRAVLEYASLVWSPIYKVHIDKLESIQRRFLKFLCYKVDKHYPPQGICHQQLLQKFSFTSLESRRKFNKLYFLFKLLSGNIDCIELLSKLNFHVPRISSRKKNTFYIDQARTNTYKMSPIFKICSEANKFDIDMFGIAKLEKFRQIARAEIAMTGN